MLIIVSCRKPSTSPQIGGALGAAVLVLDEGEDEVHGAGVEVGRVSGAQRLNHSIVKPVNSWQYPDAQCSSMWQQQRLRRQVAPPYGVPHSASAHPVSLEGAGHAADMSSAATALLACWRARLSALWCLVVRVLFLRWPVLGPTFEIF